MNRDNINSSNLNNSTLSGNIQNYDHLKQKKESFLAPTPSYKPDFPVNLQNQDQKTLNSEYIKGPGSTQYIDLIHHPSNTLFGGNPLFGVPQSPAYPNQPSVNYFIGSPNNSIPNYTHNESGIDLNTSMNNNVMNSSLVGIISQSIKSDPNKKGDGFSVSGLAPPSSYGIVSDPGEEIQPKLQNIVSTANLKCPLNLREIALKAKNAEYNPKRFAAVIMRIKEPKTTALIFASGKMVCTGARSEQDSRKAARQYAKIIQKLGYDKVRFSEFKIQNIVGSCDVKFQISLEGLSAGTKSSSYEPEIFPGLIFKMLQPKIVLLIFVSGKIVLTGAKEKEEIFEAFKKIYPVLQRYKKKTFEKTNDTTSDQGKGEEH